MQARRSHAHVADGLAASSSQMLRTALASRVGCCFVSEGQIPARQKNAGMRKRAAASAPSTPVSAAGGDGWNGGVRRQLYWDSFLTAKADEAQAGLVPQVGGATSGFLAVPEGLGPFAGIRGGGV